MSSPYRQFVIDKVKRPIQNALEAGESFAEVMKVIKNSMTKLVPFTRQNCLNPNTLVWFTIFDKFLEMEDNPGREPIFRAVIKLFLAEEEHDHSYYGVRGDVVLELWLEEVLKGNYKPRSLDHPDSYWKSDPNSRGAGFKLIQYCYSQKKQGKEIDPMRLKEIIK